MSMEAQDHVCLERSWNVPGLEQSMERSWPGTFHGLFQAWNIPWNVPGVEIAWNAPGLENSMDCSRPEASFELRGLNLNYALDCRENYNQKQNAKDSV